MIEIFMIPLSYIFALITLNRSKTIRVNDEINETQSNGRRIKIILSRFVRAFPQKEKMERMKGGRVNETKAVN